jgi:WD40 repeat protein
MFGLSQNRVFIPKPDWTGRLNDYVTAIAFSSDGKFMAAASASGEISLCQNQKLVVLQPATDSSVDCLGFSADNKWLAAAGQDGQIRVWDLQSDRSTPTISLDQGSAWIDHLVWHPVRSEFAFNLGKYVQVWSAETQDIITTVSFDDSSVIALNWHPSGNWLTVGGYQGVKIWDARNWDQDPYVWKMDTAIIVMAWNSTGKYLAAASIDAKVLQLEYFSDRFMVLPFVLSGFAHKIRAIAWSNLPDYEPILTIASGHQITAWRRHQNPDHGWEPEEVAYTEANVGFLEFQPQSLLLAAASHDKINLWKQVRDLAQTLSTKNSEITYLKWHPQGHRLAAGTNTGEILIWATPKTTKGFA